MAQSRKKLNELFDNLKSRIEEIPPESAIEADKEINSEAEIEDDYSILEYAPKFEPKLIINRQADPNTQEAYYHLTPDRQWLSYESFKRVNWVIDTLKKRGHLLEDEQKIFEYVTRYPLEEGMSRSLYIEDIVKEFKLDVDYQPLALVNRLHHMVGGSAITSGVKALRDPHWGKNSLGKACYTHKKADKTNSYITHYIQDLSNTEELALLPHSEAIQILEKFGVYPALLHLILAVHFYKQPDPNTAFLRLKGTDLIKDLGLDNRTDLTKSQKLERVNEIITAVTSLIITCQWSSEVSVKKGKRVSKKQLTFTVEPCIMWNITTVNITKKDIFGNEELIDIDVRAKAGGWLSCFFDYGGYQLGTSLYNFATLSQKILDLDPYHEELALRIALLQSTMDYRRYYTVEQWLIENLLSAKNKIAEAKSDRIKRKKLADLWDNTLLSLERIGFEIHYDKSTYPEELRPKAERKPRGYFERLLEAKIKLTPETLGKPESGQDAIEAEKIPVPENVYRGKDLKQSRLKANVSPKQIAKYLDCSQGKIYNAEKRDNLSKKLFKEILDAIKYISKYPDKY